MARCLSDKLAEGILGLLVGQRNPLGKLLHILRQQILLPHKLPLSYSPLFLRAIALARLDPPFHISHLL